MSGWRKTGGNASHAGNASNTCNTSNTGTAETAGTGDTILWTRVKTTFVGAECSRSAINWTLTTLLPHAVEIA